MKKYFLFFVFQKTTLFSTSPPPNLPFPFFLGKICPVLWFKPTKYPQMIYKKVFSQKICWSKCGICMHMVSISWEALTFLLNFLLILYHSQLPCFWTPFSAARGVVKKTLKWKRAQPVILCNKIHSTVVLISSTNTSQHRTLMRKGFQLDTVWHWPSFSVTFNCQR